MSKRQRKHFYVYIEPNGKALFVREMTGKAPIWIGQKQTPWEFTGKEDAEEAVRTLQKNGFHAVLYPTPEALQKAVYKIPKNK